MSLSSPASLTAWLFAAALHAQVGAQPGAPAPAEPDAGSPETRLQRAREAMAELHVQPAASAGEGLRTRARRDLLWCFDRDPRADRTFAPVRLGEVLDLLGALAESDVVTRNELLARRDQRAARVERGALDNNLLAELLALDEVLGDGDHSVALYTKVAARHDRDALTFFYGRVRPELWRARKYDLLLAGRPDALARVDAAASALREAQKRLGAGKLQPSPGFVAGVVQDTAVDFEARVGKSRYEDAEQLAKALLALAPGERTLARLVAHAERADREEYAKQFAATGLGDVSAEAVAQFWQQVAEQRVALAHAAGEPNNPRAGQPKAAPKAGR